MKKIDVIIRPSKVGDVCDALEKIGHPGVIITEIEGHGNQKGIEQKIRGKTYKIDLITKARLEVVVKNKDLTPTLNAIREAAYTGEVGDGKIFISNIEDAVRIRTNDRGDSAI